MLPTGLDSVCDSKSAVLYKIFDKDADLPGIHRNIFLCKAWMHYRHSYHTHRFQNHYIVPKAEHHQIKYISSSEHITERFTDCVGSAP